MDFSILEGKHRSVSSSKSSRSCGDLSLGTSVVVSVCSFSNPTCNEGGDDDDVNLSID